MRNISKASAILALGLSLGLASAARADVTPGPIAVARGQSVSQAIAQAQLTQRVATLRAQWLSTHRTPSTAVPPQILSGSILTPTLTVAVAKSVPVIKFTYTTGSPGLAFVQVILTSPDGLVSLLPLYAQGTRTTGGTIVFSNPDNLPYFSQPGPWSITGAYISDQSGNYTQYDQAQAQALFTPSAVTVVNNGPVDITPPVVTSGTLLTPTVSLSSPLPEFRATLTGTDNASGIYVAFVGILPPGGQFSYVNQVPRAFPTLSGTTNAYSQVFAGSPTGTWTISFYELCDVVDNCFTDTTPADIQKLFGTTTFTVTN